MRATCTKVLKSGKVKTVVGTVLQRGMDAITLVINQPNGQVIKRFKESEYTVRIID